MAHVDEAQEVKAESGAADTSTMDDPSDEVAESRLAVDVSVYGGASEIPCEIWPDEDQVSSTVVLDYFGRLQRMRAAKYARTVPGIAPAVDKL